MAALATAVNPTPAQAAAQNYKKGRVELHGLKIAIENARGTERKGVSATGVEWSNLMQNHYGHFVGFIGNDGDGVDVFIGAWPESKRVWIVNQKNQDGSFDEHKVMLGFSDEEQARNGYLGSYSAGWQGLESICACNVEQLTWWLKYGTKSKPVTPESLPYDGNSEMNKTFDDAAELSKFIYGIRRADPDSLALDAITIEEIMADSEGEEVLDALVIPFAKVEIKLSQMQAIMNAAANTLEVSAVQVTQPFKQRGTTNVAGVFEMSDGQTVSVFFHNPDITPNRITPQDELVSWKWMLNRKDITIMVAPEKGDDLNAREVSRRIMKVAEKNSARFTKANEAKANRVIAIESMKTDIAAREQELSELQSEIADLEAQKAAKKSASEAAYAKRVGDNYSDQDAYIRAQENGGIDPKTGATSEDLKAKIDAQSAQLTAENNEAIAQGNQPWWETSKYDSVYLIDKSRGNDSVTVSIKSPDEYEVKIALSGVGGEFSGSIANAKSWLKSRMQGMGSAMSGNEMTDSELGARLKLVKGVDILGVFEQPAADIEYTISDVIAAMQKTTGATAHSWFLDKDVDAVLRFAAKKGWVIRPSTTQVWWSDEGNDLAKAARESIAEPITLTGKELGDFPDTPEGKKALRVAAKDALNEIKGTMIPCPALNADVEVRKSGIEKVISQSADARKLKICASISDLISTGVKIGERLPYNGDTDKSAVKYYTLRAAIKIEENLLAVRLVIKEDNNGVFHYDHTVHEPEAVLDSAIENGLPEGSPSAATNSNGGGTDPSHLASYQPEVIVDSNNEPVNTLDSAGSGMVFNLFIEGEEPEVVPDEDEPVVVADGRDKDGYSTDPEGQKTKAMVNLKKISPFLSGAQRKVIAQNMQGEEGQFFVDKVNELADIIATMPVMYEQDGKGDKAIVYLHYFMGSIDSYITEKDMEGDGTEQAFGYQDIGYGGELGGISIAELVQNRMELDLYWTPKTLGEVVGINDDEPEPVAEPDDGVSGFEKKTLAMAMAEQIVEEFGLKMGEWIDGATIGGGWMFAAVNTDGLVDKYGSQIQISLGASDGGVVSVNGDPFSPIDRKLNDNYITIRESIAALLPVVDQKTVSPLDEFEAGGGVPWQVTQAKWVEIMTGHMASLGDTPVPDDYKEFHKSQVKKALDENLPVPAEVLADYPDMTAETLEEKAARYAEAERNLNNLIGTAAGEAPVVSEITENPEMTEAKQYLQSVIDGSADMLDPEIPEKFNALYEKFTGDVGFDELMNQAVEAYTNFALGESTKAMT